MVRFASSDPVMLARQLPNMGTAVPPTRCRKIWILFAATACNTW